MNFSRYCILTLLIIFTSLNSRADPGCLISDGTVYSRVEDNGLVNAVLALVFGGVPVYKGPIVASSTTCVANSYTVYVPTSSNCTVCPSGYATVTLLGVTTVTGCVGASSPGKIANPTIMYCNLDDYTWTLGAAAGLFGLFVIRKRNKL